MGLLVSSKSSNYHRVRNSRKQQQVGSNFHSENATCRASSTILDWPTYIKHYSKTRLSRFMLRISRCDSMWRRRRRKCLRCGRESGKRTKILSDLFLKRSLHVALSFDSPPRFLCVRYRQRYSVTRSSTLCRKSINRCSFSSSGDSSWKSYFATLLHYFTARYNKIVCCNRWK
jgi:hypothetical protein